MADSQESSVGSGAIQLIEEDESPVNSSINTTPLVDIMLVLLIIQLTSAGGTYPPELLPPFFSAISHFVPMSYSIDAINDLVAGDTAGIWPEVAILAAFIAGALALGVVTLRRRTA